METIIKCPKCKSEKCDLFIEDGAIVIRCFDCKNSQDDVGMNEILEDWVRITT